MGIEGISGWQLIMAGGPIMVPLLLCSIFAFGIIIDKLMYFSKISKDTAGLKHRVFELVRDHKIREALETCENNPSPVARIMKAGIARFGSSREEIKEAIEDISLFEIPKLEKGLSALATVANISPLLGLLGTVMGMTGSFYTIQVRSAGMNQVTSGDLAGGIWQALITTVAGLLVAIPTFVAYNYCVSRVNGFIMDMERTATELVNYLSQIADVENLAKEEESSEV